MKYVVIFLFISLSFHLQAQNADSAFATKAKQAKTFLYETGRAFRITLQLTGIYVYQEQCYFSFAIHNKSKLFYPVDFIRFYIRDRVQTKRSSAQELEIIPVYLDSITDIPAKSTVKFVLSTGQFTIPDKKECFIEMFELNGGRNLSLKISNPLIFSARTLH